VETSTVVIAVATTLCKMTSVETAGTTENLFLLLRRRSTNGFSNIQTTSYPKGLTNLNSSPSAYAALATPRMQRNARTSRRNLSVVAVPVTDFRGTAEPVSGKLGIQRTEKILFQERRNGDGQARKGVRTSAQQGRCTAANVVASMWWTRISVKTVKQLNPNQLHMK